MLIIVGIPLLFYLLVGWFFFRQAVVFEGKRPINSLKQSRALVKGTWWRVFGIIVLLVLVCLGMVALSAIPDLVASPISRPLGRVLLMAPNILWTPVYMIAATLVHFDLRIRKGGFTLEALRSEVSA